MTQIVFVSYWNWNGHDVFVCFQNSAFFERKISEKNTSKETFESFYRIQN